MGCYEYAHFTSKNAPPFKSRMVHDMAVDQYNTVATDAGPHCANKYHMPGHVTMYIVSCNDKLIFVGLICHHATVGCKCCVLVSLVPRTNCLEQPCHGIGSSGGLQKSS